MIPIFIPVSTQTPTSVFNELNTVASGYLKNRLDNINPVQVQTQVPYWMIKNSDGDGNSSLMINFLQSYYDWLSNFYGFTGTNLFEISNLFDISSAPNYLLPNFVNYYACDMKGIFELSGSERPTDDAIRNTVINVKNEIYQNKSNETAFKRLIGTLFSVDTNTISIKYPKRKIMRLNAGVLEWMTAGASYFGITGEYSNERYTLVGSYLNQGVLQDSEFWQEYSYVLDSSLDDSNPYYEQVVKETLHPAGLKGFYEQTELFAEVADGDEDLVRDYEIPIIANYYPYTLGSIETLDKCTGCTTGSPLFVPGWTFPTFVYPTWDEDILTQGPSADFGSIIVRVFTELRSKRGQESPNDLIGVRCDLACDPIEGEANFNWKVGTGGKYTVYTINEIVNEPQTEREETDPGFG